MDARGCSVCRQRLYLSRVQTTIGWHPVRRHTQLQCTQMAHGKLWLCTHVVSKINIYPYMKKYKNNGALRIWPIPNRVLHVLFRFRDVRDVEQAFLVDPLYLKHDHDMPDFKVTMPCYIGILCIINRKCQYCCDSIYLSFISL